MPANPLRLRRRPKPGADGSRRGTTSSVRLSRAHARSAVTGHPCVLHTGPSPTELLIDINDGSVEKGPATKGPAPAKVDVQGGSVTLG
ncbi:hypothetical protein ACIGW8_25740 [Streptomyces sioyaensis]|uniref:hypothetical protein n=1 Tax=Streptomyces sioyaensis TaxID=67364 RepID=UPI0037D6809F